MLRTERAYDGSISALALYVFYDIQKSQPHCFSFVLYLKGRFLPSVFAFTS